jgi:CBS domain containing-hemolysin-like protein/ssRNA-specific RNase YbeY (16S rRNA maturation enzyme)
MAPDEDSRRTLRVLVADERGRRVRAGSLASWLRRVAPAAARGTVSVALVSDRRVRLLNRTYRQKDYATDVLSFSPGDPGIGPARLPGHGRFLGDIVIARRRNHAPGRAAAAEEGRSARGADRARWTGRTGAPRDAWSEAAMIPLGIFLLCCAAVYLGAIDAAFSALMRLSLRLVAERTKRPGALSDYLDDPLLLFAPVRLLLGLVTGAATALLGRAIGVDAHTLPLVIVAVAAFVIICQLLLPLVIVGRDPERILEMLLPTFTPIARALGPLTRTIARSVASTRRGNGVAPADAAAEQANEVAKAYIDTAEHEGIIEGEERRLLQSIVDFGDILVREVMTPRPDIVAISADATVGDLRALFREQEYSRFPVYREGLDNIAGFVFVKDLVALDPADDKRPITSLLRTAVVVPETKRVPELLKQFQRQQTQCALVVDEYGGTAGLVTIEDLLEEIVGEIRDEYDVESEPVVDEGHGRFVFSGKVSIDELVERLNVEVDRAGGFETVGGYLLSQIGRVPNVGERFHIDGLSVEILDAQRRRINMVRIARGSCP